jgi:hypothetical protein
MHDVAMSISPRLAAVAIVARVITVNTTVNTASQLRGKSRCPDEFQMMRSESPRSESEPARSP